MIVLQARTTASIAFVEMFEAVDVTAAVDVAVVAEVGKRDSVAEKLGYESPMRVQYSLPVVLGC